LNKSELPTDSQIFVPENIIELLNIV
jgi:hypothetical protein